MVADPAYFEEPLFCPTCDKDTYNIIEKKGGSMAWICCACLSLIGGLCLVPFFFDGFMDAYVICIECNQVKTIE